MTDLGIFNENIELIIASGIALSAWYPTTLILNG